MFAIVEKRKRDEITILVDKAKAKYMPDYPHLYYFETLNSSVREYLSIRKSEFTRFGSTLLDPLHGAPPVAECTANTQLVQDAMVSFMHQNQGALNEG